MVDDAADVDAILCSAIELPSPEERAEFVRKKCGDDESLRLRVQQLVDAHFRAGSFLDRPAVASADTQLFGTVAEAPGTVIGPYKLLQQIGEGGMGVVFMAEQERPVRRRVALKVIKPGMDTRQVIARFEAERQALAMMEHSNIARVLDAGTTATGRSYFVMDLVKGVPITDYCDKHQLSIPKRLELFSQVCQAVQHAHQKGIIHRDLKSSNVLVAEYDGKPVPKVIDFGVAKATAQRLTERTMFTQYGQIIGTFEYMSPEQARFNQLDIDTRSDIYSLGVLVYELLTGSTPLQKERLRSAAFDEILRLISEEEPPKPSTRLSSSETLPSIAANRRTEPARLSKDVHGELDWIVMKCLEKDRNRRYETASALADDIQRYLNDEALEARPATRIYRLKKFIRRNKASVLVGTAIGGALLIGFALATIGFVQARRQAARADYEAKNALSQAARSDQVAQFLKDMLKGVGPNVAMGRDTEMLRDIVDKTAARIHNDLKDQPEVQAEIFLVLANVYFQLQDYIAMEAMARKTLEIAQGELGAENLVVADALSTQGGGLMVLRRIDEAELAARQAIALQRKLRGRGSIEEAKALVLLAAVLRHKMPRSPESEHHSIIREAESSARQAVAIFKSRHADDHDDLAWSLNELRVVLHVARKFEEAEEVMREATRIRKRIHGDVHPYLASDYRNLGGALLARGKLDEAEKCFRDALEIGKKMGIQGKNSEIWTHAGLADVLMVRGDRDQAETHRREAVSILRKEFGVDYPGLPEFLNALATTLRQNGKLDEARDAAEEAVAICRRNPNSIPKSTQDAALLELKSVLAAISDRAAPNLQKD